MRQLLGDSATAAEGPLLRELFLQRLPSNVRMVLASSADKSLEEVAELAHKIITVAPPTVSTISPSASEVDSLQAEIKQLRELVSTLSSTSQSPRLHLPSPRRRQP